ncbi:MAG: DUF3800 domain-containing protein [Coriobacteriia bacterium]
MPAAAVHTAGCTYNVYCDESRHTSNPGDRYLAIGALSCPRDAKRELVRELHVMRARWKTQGEVGWKRVSRNRTGFYLELIDWFAGHDELQFRCLLADRQSLNHDLYSDGDVELGFYKLYYQLLVHWLTPDCAYHLYLDWQQNSQKDRFAELRRILRLRLAGGAQVLSLEPVESHSNELMQLADLLTGAMSYTWNEADMSDKSSSLKVELLKRLAEHLGRADLKYSTPPDEPKFNIFSFPHPKYRPRGDE